MSNIVLIGFCGVGKSSVAKELSKDLNLSLIDTDVLISCIENKSIKEIFEEDELSFRNIEERLSTFLQKNIKNSIISVGGGFTKLKGLGKIIYLRASFNYIFLRLKDEIASRPIFNDLNRAKEIYLNRLELYEKNADLIIDVENKSIKDIALNIKESL